MLGPAAPRGCRFLFVSIAEAPIAYPIIFPYAGCTEARNPLYHSYYLLTYMKYLALFIALIVIGWLGWVGYNRHYPPTIDPTGETKSFTLVIADGKITEGPQILAVTHGDIVEITITNTTDDAEEIHVHGYNHSVELVKDTPATLSFMATASGRFPFELEKQKIDLGAIEVTPQ